MSSIRNPFRDKLLVVIFGTDTKAGKLFDLVLLWAIILSVLVVILESMDVVELAIGRYLMVLEWIFTIMFTIEYVLRIYATRHPRKYIFSFWGFVDLFSFLPTYIGILFTSVHFLVAIRILRLIRIFRILKLTRYFRESQELAKALWASAHRIAVFFLVLFLIVLIMGSLMYVIEGGVNGFESIPQSIYWAIITVTTVGYGDVVPVTSLGKIVSSLIMIIGYSIIAVPTGIITAEIARSKKDENMISCPACNHIETDQESKFCRHCGTKMASNKQP
ncbi:MAG: ion transporter [Bacteroidales bacterium]|nr:ion transporter [Bacteroidales bacterium]